MAEYWIDDAELSYMFRNAKDSAGQVKILAELCAVPAEEMRRKLRSLGLNVPDREGYRHRKLNHAVAEELYMQGCSDREIAERMGVKKSTVETWRTRMGLAIAEDRRRKLDDAEVLELYRAGATDREIAEHVGVSRSSISCWRDRYGLACNRERMKISDGL